MQFRNQHLIPKRLFADLPDSSRLWGQGGDLEMALNISHENGMGIINVSRGILYAGNGSMKAVIQAARDYSDKIRGIVCDPVNC